MGPFLVKPNRRKSVTEKKKRLSPAAVGVARERERERERECFIQGQFGTDRVRERVWHEIFI